MVKNYSDSKLTDVDPTKEKGVLKKVLVKGTGDAVAENGQELTLNYVCTYQDGTQIDSSYERGRPATVILGSGQLIQGLEYGIATMKKGEKAFFRIRPCLTYSSTKQPTNLPDNRTLLFEVELIDWKPVDLSPDYDSSILKTQLERGEDSFVYPKAGRQITLNLVGKLLDGTEFDRRTDIVFTLYENGKENDICLGVELCCLSMKRNEKASVQVKRKYAFETVPERFTDKLPEDYEEVIYEVHLVSFELEKDVWEMNFDERFDEAVRSKEKGTKFYNQCKFDAAARHYQRIINYVGPDERHDFKEKNEQKNALLRVAYLNLAQTNLMMNKGLEAIHSAEMAIKLDSTNVKGFYRRAMGYFKINDFDKAIEDFDRVLKMEPSNSAAKKQKSLCLQELKKVTQKEKKIFERMFDRLGEEPGYERLIVNEESDIFTKMNETPDYFKFDAKDMLNKVQDIV